MIELLYHWSMDEKIHFESESSIPEVSREPTAKTYRIVLSGGGTGGHVFPLVPVVRELKSLLGEQTEFLYLGPSGGIGEKVMHDSGIATAVVTSGKWRRPFSLKNISDGFRVIGGYVQALIRLYRFMPDAVFSKGAYAAVPVVLAAKTYAIPVLTQDSDATPGVANKIMGKFADRIAVAYPSASKYFEASRVAVTGNPVREELFHGSKDRARERFDIQSDKPVLLVLGGSLGSVSVNRAIVGILPRLLERCSVVHQTGEGDAEETAKRVTELGLGDLSGRYFATPFFDTGALADALSLADLIVSRAGANAIADIAAVGKSSILIPLPSAANDEQRMNAYEMARVGASLVLEELNLGENLLFGKIDRLLDDKVLREKMEKAAQTFFHPDAAHRIAEGIVALIREREARVTFFEKIVILFSRKNS